MSRIKGVKNKKVAASLAFNHSVYRLVISYITGYGTFSVLPKGTKRQPHLNLALDQLKQAVLDRLHQRQKSRGLDYWSVAWQIHPGAGLPHLDVLLHYRKNRKCVSTSFDWLFKELKIQQKQQDQSFTPGHVWITPYSSRKFSQAILQYGFKQDPFPLFNLPQDTSPLLQLHKFKSDPYKYLYDRMKQDPLHFKLEEYVQKHQLSPHITSWSSLKTKLKDMQVAAANLVLKQKPGFRFIDRPLIKQALTSQEHRTFTKNVCFYGKIVAKLNQIVVHKWNRLFKTKHLFLVGPADTGKTSLIRQVQRHCATYHMDVSNWFPNYRDQVYTLLSWDQFKLKGGMSHTDLLKFLQGSPMDLQYKGGSSLRRDNQLIIMTSNMTLQQHIRLKFKDQQQRRLARQNLRVRIEQLILPVGLDLFLLQKLIMQ